ncbi:MAG: response regulator [Thermonemataceae bacterium]|nr:response regulator [Thermonemataceae bacterium]
MLKTILLIEDNEEIRENTAEMLELAGYTVSTAENGKIGVEKALEQKPDLVICDIMMPIMDGYGVLQIFMHNPELSLVPFIFLTAKTERADIRKGMEMGADDYLTKPFTESELLGTVESRLKRAESMKKIQPSSDEFESFLDEAKADSELKNLLTDRKIFIYKKKQIIYAEENEANKIFFIKKGKVKTYQTNLDGKDFITGIFCEGDFFGYVPILENTLHTDTAETLEDCEIISVPRNDFLTLIHQKHSVAQKFIRMLAGSVIEKEKFLLGMAYNSLRKRIADTLVALHQKYQTEKSAGVGIQISRDNLASMVGTATESLIRTLSDFKQEGYIEINEGKILIKDEKKLANLRY